jgi:hypothetical protein
MFAKDLLEVEVCNTCSINIPEHCKIYGIKAKSFTYGGGKVPSLPHCYSAPTTNDVLSTILTALPPSLEPIKSNETMLAKSVIYYGMLTSYGLQEYSGLRRPIETYYSPPLVDIVKDDKGDVRPILVDSAYICSNTQDIKNNETLNSLKEHIVNCQKSKKYSEAKELYKSFGYECEKLLWVLSYGQ